MGTPVHEGCNRLRSGRSDYNFGRRLACRDHESGRSALAQPEARAAMPAIPLRSEPGFKLITKIAGPVENAGDVVTNVRYDRRTRPQREHRVEGSYPVN